MAPSPRASEERPEESPIGDGRTSEDEIRPETGPDPSAILHDDAEAGAFRDHFEKARRLVALELDLAETRRRLAEDNLKITEAQLQLAERELEVLRAENESLRREIEALRGGDAGRDAARTTAPLTPRFAPRPP
jgi:hypothetical protein